MKAPKIIPPGSVVRPLKADSKVRAGAWAKCGARRFRVGYYSRQDGLDCIWLVNSAGEYEQTIDRRMLLRHFAIESLAANDDYYGDSSPPLGPVQKSSRSKGPSVPNPLVTVR